MARPEEDFDQLDEAERQEEVARLLAGVEITDKARAHASELIRNAALR